MYNQKVYFKALLVLGALIFFIMWILKGKLIDMSIIPIALSASGVTLLFDQFIFKKFLWGICPNLFYKIRVTNSPYLGGNWTGYLHSDYIYPETNKTGDPIKASMKIIHKFDCIRIQLETNQSYSSSYASDITEDGGEQKYLCYLYVNDADKDRHLNPKHDGAVKLRIKENDELILEGNYWTGRKTTGTMKFERK
ncbi:hypothetical protein [Bacillus cereus]|uniref:Cap15 family cyclic dinucleotide receptor domain-containing protein n=1 Tax=Bacillus cereus TaxID=1396 RepID=UPI000BFD1491|nr:hypothetical protein [Bacillus cereus]PGY94668.1 hypothetical protein COE05_12655 [Bacillus cereus]